MNSLQYT